MYASSINGEFWIIKSEKCIKGYAKLSPGDENRKLILHNLKVYNEMKSNIYHDRFVI